MKSHSKALLSVSERDLLDGVTLPPHRTGKRDCFDPLRIAQHYLHTAVLIGEPLCAAGATLRGFYDVVRGQGHRIALALVICSKPTWLPKS